RQIGTAPVNDPDVIVGIRALSRSCTTKILGLPRRGGCLDSLLVYAKGACQHGAYGVMRNRIRRLTALARSLNSEPLAAQFANTRFLARPDVRVRPAMPNSPLADRAHRTPPRR